MRPCGNGWEVYESAGVQPLFLNQEDAVDYATGRAWFRTGEIRILDSSGATERVIPFDEQGLNRLFSADCPPELELTIFPIRKDFLELRLANSVALVSGRNPGTPVRDCLTGSIAVGFERGAF